MSSILNFCVVARVMYTVSVATCQACLKGENCTSVSEHGEAVDKLHVLQHTIHQLREYVYCYKESMISSVTLHLSNL